MKALSSVNPMVRAVGMFAAVAALVTAVTFAALSSSATLTNSSITTGLSDVQVYNFSIPDWSDTAPGFTVTNLIPGTGYNNSFYLRNTGSNNYNLTASVPVLPGPPSDTGVFGFSGYDNVKVDIKCQNSGVVVNTDLQALNTAPVALPCVLNGGVAGDSNVAGAPGNYDIHFDINPAAITGNSAGVGNFDIVISGNQAL